MTVRSLLVSGTAAIVHSAGRGAVVAAVVSVSSPAAAQFPSTINPRQLLEMDPPALIRLVNESRPAPVSAVVRAHVLAGLPKKGQVENLDESERRKLAGIAPVLEAAQRGSVYAVKIIDVPHAFVGLHERAVVLITRSALRVLSEKELRAALAHETAHEYVHDEYARATAEDRRSRVQDLELVCDMLAVLTLRAIRQEARSLPAAIEKLEWFNRVLFGYEVDPAHPSVMLRRTVTLALDKKISRAREAGEWPGSPSTPPDRR